MWVRIRNREWVSKWAVSTLLTEYWVTSGETLIKHVAPVMHFFLLYQLRWRFLLALIMMCWWIRGLQGNATPGGCLDIQRKSWGAESSPAPLLYSQLPPLLSLSPGAQTSPSSHPFFGGTGSSCMICTGLGPLRMTGGPWIKHRLVCFVLFWANDVLVMKYLQLVTFAD